MSKLSTFSSQTPRPVFAFGAILGLCLLLAGCPLGSNPTQTQTSSSSGEPPGGAAGSSGGGGAGASPSAGSTAGNQANGGVAGGTGNSPEGSIDGSDAGTGSEPGFGDEVSTAEGVPDLRDTPPRNTETAADGTAKAGHDSGGTGATTDAGDGDGTSPGAVAGGASEGRQDGALTPEERIAVLDAELVRGTGEFDALIVKTQEAQREAARSEAPQGGGKNSAGERGASGGDSPLDGGLADAGGYSTGGGMGGTAGGGMPDSSAKYPPPGDIPSGDDDDVVARQLREAATREPDPAVRERLWAEYRKYKGLTP